MIRRRKIRAAVLRGGQLSVDEVELVVPEGAEELEVAACGICGSDLRYLAGEDAWAAHTLGEARRLPQAMVLGHEIAAWRTASEGRRLVALIPFFTCGRCADCRRGRSNLCRFTVHHGHGQLSSPGRLMFPGFAEYTAAYPFQMLDAPPGFSADELTLLDGLAVAIHALRASGLQAGHAICVMGAGPIGLSVLQAAGYMGARVATAVDISETAAERARRVGATAALVASSTDDSGALRALAPEGFDVVVDTTGSPDAQRLALNVLRRGGTAVMLAGLAHGLELVPSDLAGEKRIVGSCNCFREDYELGLKMMAKGAFNAAAMITHVFPLREIGRAFEIAGDKAAHDACKVVIHP